MLFRTQHWKNIVDVFEKGCSQLGKRSFAQVQDIRIEVEKEIGQRKKGYRSMELNVFKKPLQLHGTRPVTGFMRTGYCEVPTGDYGNHSVAAELTNEFLDFSASKGNDLRGAGLTSGCKWCLCVSRWKEAFDARTGDQDPKMPKVWMSRTNQKALEGVGMEELRKFALDKESE